MVFPFTYSVGQRVKDRKRSQGRRKPRYEEVSEGSETEEMKRRRVVGGRRRSSPVRKNIVSSDDDYDARSDSESEMKVSSGKLKSKGKERDEKFIPKSFYKKRGPADDDFVHIDDDEPEMNARSSSKSESSKKKGKFFPKCIHRRGSSVDDYAQIEDDEPEMNVCSTSKSKSREKKGKIPKHIHKRGPRDDFDPEIREAKKLYYNIDNVGNCLDDDDCQIEKEVHPRKTWVPTTAVIEKLGDERRFRNSKEPKGQGMDYIENLTGQQKYKGKRHSSEHSSRHVVGGKKTKTSWYEGHSHRRVANKNRSGKGARKQHKNNSAVDGKHKKYFIPPTKKGSKVEKTSKVAVHDSSKDSSSFIDTDSDDPEDEDFKEGNSYSSVSDGDEDATDITDESSDMKGKHKKNYGSSVSEEDEDPVVEVTEESSDKKDNHEKNSGSSVIEGDEDSTESGGNPVNNSGCQDEAHHESNKSMENLNGAEPNELDKKQKSAAPKPKQHNFVNVLINTIIGEGEMLEDQTQETDEKEPAEPELLGKKVRTLPLKFWFEDEDVKPVEKSDSEIEADELFDELMIADMMDESDTIQDGSKAEDASDIDEETDPCSRGIHDLRIDDEIGLICRSCGHVEREIRYMDPEFAPKSRRETFTARSEKYPAFNFDFSAGEGEFGKAFNASKGTVWDAIPGAKSKMYEHQQEGFEFMWKNLEGSTNLAEVKNSDSSEIGGCIISHAPGTGKTLLTIVFLRSYLRIFPESKPIIIAPAGMLLTWEEEFKKWNVDVPFHNVNSLEFSGNRHKKLLDSAAASGNPDKDVIRWIKIYLWSKERSVLGISYNLFENLVGEEYREKKGGRKKGPKESEQSESYRKILLESPRLIIMDEGHTPRSSKSCIWNTLLKLQTRRKIILTGTPFQNNFEELFNTLRLVRPATAENLAKEKEFADMITARGQYSQRRVHKRTEAENHSLDEPVDSNIEKLKAVMAPFVHIHKGHILKNSLPGLNDVVILLKPPPQQKRLIELVEIRHSSFKYDHKVALVSTHPSLVKFCNLDEKEKAQIDLDAFERLRLDPTVGVKTNFVMELVRFSEALKEKVLIFGQFIQIHKLMAEQLKANFNWEEGRQFVQMQGKQEQKQRQSIINKFNDPNSEAIVLLASTKCCSEGINLVGASRVVLLDVVWNPSVERQAISRAYRLGQKRVVHTYHLMTEGTTEDEKYYRQAEKDRLSELVFSSTAKEKNVKQHRPDSGYDDVILDMMLKNHKFKDVFEKVIYQPKEANLIKTFTDL